MQSTYNRNHNLYATFTEFFCRKSYMRIFKWDFHPSGLFPRLLLRLVHLRLTPLACWLDAAVVMGRGGCECAILKLNKKILEVFRKKLKENRKITLWVQNSPMQLFIGTSEDWINANQRRTFNFGTCIYYCPTPQRHVRPRSKRGQYCSRSCSLNFKWRNGIFFWCMLSNYICFVVCSVRNLPQHTGKRSTIHSRSRVTNWTWNSSSRFIRSTTNSIRWSYYRVKAWRGWVYREESIFFVIG